LRSNKIRSKSNNNNNQQPTKKQKATNKQQQAATEAATDLLTWAFWEIQPTGSASSHPANG